MSSPQIPEISAIFGEVLKRQRVEQNVSQEELAFGAGLDRTFVSRLERGIRQPTITTMIGLGLALGVSAAEMVRETEKQYLASANAGQLTRASAPVKEKRGKYSKPKKR